VESSLEAYVLINTEASVSWQVVEAVLKIEGVKTGHVVTGQFDAIVLVQFSELDDFRKIIARIQRVKGVLRTQTLLAVPSPSRTVNVMPSLAEEEKTGPDNYPDR
jgi:DNA-binding Lrp family transcriptional regulator